MIAARDIAAAIITAALIAGLLLVTPANAGAPIPKPKPCTADAGTHSTKPVCQKG